MNEPFIVTEELEIHPIALIMPPMGDQEFKEFKEDISGNGLLDPIVLFQGKVLDGRNRYRACKELEIDVYARQWEGGMDPVDYVASKNLHRRQLSVGQRSTVAAKIIRYYSDIAKEEQRKAGGDRKSEEYRKSLPAPVREAVTYTCPECGEVFANRSDCPTCDRKSREASARAAKTVGVSARSVESAKFIIEHGTDEEKKAVESGSAGLKPVEQQIRQRVASEQPALTIHKPEVERSSKAKFNQTTDSIEWARWTWNPVTGCEHDCSYCYAREFAARYPDAFPNGFKPTFHESRLSAPQNTKIPHFDDPGFRRVFVGSMADLFGEWVPQEWIDKVLDACAAAPQWTFLFLTKNPMRLPSINFPENSWVGTTVDCQDRVDAAVKAFRDVRAKVKFVSCEPLLGPVIFPTMDVFDWVIIGGKSRSANEPAKQPNWRWVETILMQARRHDCSVYFKPNLTVVPKETPDEDVETVLEVRTR